MNRTAQASRATSREWIGLGVLALACLLYVMDLTVLDLAIPADLQRSYAQRARQRVELPTGHHPFLSQPDLLAATLGRVLS